MPKKKYLYTCSRCGFSANSIISMWAHKWKGLCK